MAWVHRQSRHFFSHGHRFVHIRKIQLRMYALRVQIHGQSHQIHIPRALTIAKQTALYPCRSRQLRQFCRSHTRTSIVVWMHTDGCVRIKLQHIYHGFNLIGIHIRCIHLNRGRQIQYQWKIRTGLPRPHHRLTDGYAEIQFGHTERLR